MTSDSSAAGTAQPSGLDATTALASLGDESRRRLLDFVRRAPHPVTRDDVAAALGMSRKLAVFHLEKLVASGLLRSGRGGHGTPGGGPHRAGLGRRSRLYEPVPGTLAVRLPPHRHELLASLLAEAITAQRPGESAREAALRVARERGGRLGAQAHVSGVRAVLGSLGFEPAEEGAGRTVLRNCPFHPVAAQAPDLVCGMNHAFLRAYLAAAGEDDRLTAVLTSRPGLCCVELRRTVTAEDGVSGTAWVRGPCRSEGRPGSR
ncbi:transcriptional regulator [Streptomyces sp. NPDC047000]|uniref:helix-turn-helix transcriptional regulator n=1 Tax=Streptomyces sp. NPDC047000 TaxID=3155474 RepID=UPI00341187D6